MSGHGGAEPARAARLRRLTHIGAGSRGGSAARCGRDGKPCMFAVMSFLREYAASDVGARTALTLWWLAGRSRELFEELQREQPIFSTPSFVLITRYAEALEVLTRGDVFLGHALEARRQPHAWAAYPRAAATSARAAWRRRDHT